ncbi:restriction endonuclease subunit S [Gordonia alkaliphila]|uniref:restriction endonuclease subunit S n=1 Tax=Gordonia alkaliphila TaxID=1053547 RepID=UPI001FF34F98|nr:restriction endonuclease subunit S [Gordonia alkaliphila]MCK0439393.1 restriction endonuclease subunit S [Gordonia alkaliphila]
MIRWHELPLRRLAECWDYLRVPLNSEQRNERPGAIPYWGANSIQGYVDIPLVDEEVVLIGEDGAPFFDRNRPVAFHIDGPIWPNNHIHVLKPNGQTDARWLAYALNCVDYSRYIYGSTRDKLTQSALMRIVVAVPPTVEEQRTIADFLDRETARIDTLIEEQQRLISLLRERERTATTVTFGCRVTRGERLKWRFDEIDDRAGTRSTVLPLMSVSITWGVRRRDEVTENIPRAEDLSNYKICRAGDIVINRMRAFQGALGVSRENGIVSPDYAVLRTRNIVSTEWLAAVMKSDLFVAEMASRIKGIGSADLGSARTPRINISDLSEIRVDIPPFATQTSEIDQYRTQRARLVSLIEAAETFITLARERRTALITAAVTGQIDVRDEVA